MSELDIIQSVQYRPTVGYSGYRVGNDGSVWSKRSRWRLLSEWRELKPARHLAGYRMLTLQLGNSVEVKRLVHHLVLEAFVGLCPEGMECRHLDGNRWNCNLSNLCWGTPLENMEDKRRHGTVPMGDNHQSAVITSDLVVKMRQMARNGKNAAEIAETLGYNYDTTRAAIIGRTWSHITEEPPVDIRRNCWINRR